MDALMLQSLPASSQVLDWFSERKMNVYSISCGSALLYNNIFPKHKERLNKRMSELVRTSRVWGVSQADNKAGRQKKGNCFWKECQLRSPPMMELSCKGSECSALWNLTFEQVEMYRAYLASVEVSEILQGSRHVS
jgi:hypothetical protein